MVKSSPEAVVRAHDMFMLRFTPTFELRAPLRASAMISATPGPMPVAYSTLSVGIRYVNRSTLNSVNSQIIAMTTKFMQIQRCRIK